MLSAANENGLGGGPCDDRRNREAEGVCDVADVYAVCVYRWENEHYHLTLTLDVVHNSDVYFLRWQSYCFAAHSILPLAISKIE